mgnify:CR=1 FL=1
MINPYYGEFGISPIPLELSLNYCSHKCAYCFANLNSPDRKANLVSITNLLNDFENRKTLVASLLQRRYPILISNKVDPFAATNYKLAVPLFKILHALEIPVAIQTKGGDGIEESLPFIRPSAWYISLATLDDGIRKRIEPGAPSVEERLTLAGELVRAGHHVSFGVNPIVREWLPEPSELFARLRAVGVKDVWIETLHLNNNQTRNMSAKELAAIGPAVIKRAMKLRADDDTYGYFVETIQTARAMGMETFCISNPSPSKYWEPYKRMYPDRFPIFQDFVNWCWETKHVGDPVFFDEWWDTAKANIPQGMAASVTDYIGATTPHVKVDRKVDKQMSFRDLLAVHWQEPRCKLFPFKNQSFDETTEEYQGRIVVAEDKNRLPVFKFMGRPLNKDRG